MDKNRLNPRLKKVAVARVNGAIISQYQLEAGLEGVLEPYKDTKGKVRLSQPEQYAARKQIIDNLIMRELLYQEGKRRGIKVTRQELEQGLARSQDEHETEKEFKAVLLMSGSNLEEFREQLKKDLTVNKMAAAIVEGKRKPVTSHAARKYYKAHLEEMQGPEARRVLHVEAPLDRYAAADEEEKVRKKLEKAASNLEGFEKLFSKGHTPESGLKAEDLGYIRRGRWHPLLDSIAFRTPEGTVSRIVRNDEGLHIMLVKKILPAGQLWPFEFIEEELKQKLYEMSSVSLVNEFTGKLRKKANIEILDRIADSKLEQEQQ